MPDIDFSGLGQQALSMADSASSGTPASDSSAAGATVENQPLTPQDGVGGGQPPSPQTTTTTIPATPGTPSPAVEKIFEIDLGNGRVEKLTEAQLRDTYNNGLRQSDYTRKTQELAQQRQMLEQQAAQLQQHQQVVQYAQQLLNNPQLLVQAAQQQLQAMQPVDPNQPVTVGQLQQVYGQMSQAVQQQQAQIAQAAQQYVEDRLQVADYAETINSTLNGLYQDQPVLKALPEFEDVIRYKVAQLAPQSIDEAVQAFKTVGNEMATQLQAQFTARQQQQAQQRAQLAQTGIEPPGGAAVVNQQTPNYMRKDKLDIDWKRLQQAAQSM